MVSCKKNLAPKIICRTIFLSEKSLKPQVYFDQNSISTGMIQRIFFCLKPCCLLFQRIFNRLFMHYRFNLFRTGLFAAVYGWWGCLKGSLPKICRIYPTMMKFDTVVSYLNKIHKIYMNQMTHPLSSADVRIFSSEIRTFCYMKKYRYRSHFDYIFSICF